MKKMTTFAALLLALGLARVASAQSSPTYAYASADDLKAAAAAVAKPPMVEWKAMVKGGFTMTSGDSETTGVVFGGSVSRKEGNNKLALDGNLAYGRSNVFAIVPDNPAMPTEIVGLSRDDITTTNQWLVKGRYDRFFTPNNSGYVIGQAAADQIAGKSFYGGGQVGYSRQLYKTPMHLTVAEIGYDFSYERYVTVGMTDHPPVSIHSARVFAGETLTLSKATGIIVGVEALFNLNKEGSALVYNSDPSATPVSGVDSFKDIRINGKVGLTTTIWKQLSIAFGFTLKYDENPAPLPVPSGTSLAFAPTFNPFADRVDTLTEATLIYTFF